MGLPQYNNSTPNTALYTSKESSSFSEGNMFLKCLGLLIGIPICLALVVLPILFILAKLFG